MTSAIRAIDTHYKGYRFRSRLEARWAVFFDALGLKWEYEPEGCVTAAGPYLPDFRVRTPEGAATWYEVKPEHTQSDLKFQAFAECAYDHWVAKSDEERVGKSLTRLSLLSGDPVTMLTSGKTALCPRCGHITRGAPMKSYRILLDTDYLAAGTKMWTVYCSSCFLETQHLKNYETTSPLLSDYLKPHGIGVLGARYGLSNGWVATGSTFVDRVLDAAYVARAARFEHGARG